MFINCKTDKGLLRSNNQDYLLNFRSNKFTLFIIADGMGGHNGGEIASKLAATTVRDFVYKNFINYKDINELLRDAIISANKAIYIKQSEKLELKGMGTTLTGCIIVEDKLFYGHVGDSRGYIINASGIQK